MGDKFDENNHQKELLDQACVFIERMVDKKIAADNESHRETTRHQSRNTIGGFLLVAVTLGVGAGGIITNGRAENQDRDEKTLRETNRRKLDIISSISGAITGMRELKDIALTYCEKGMTPEQKQSLKVDRVKRRFELVHAARPMMHFFNDNFRTLIINFLAWEESIVDYCAPSAPSEAVWQTKQKEIENQMVLSPTRSFADS
jgi:hypothetical protein